MPQRTNRSGDISIWEVPEIDGVRRSLETNCWDDEASDSWLRMIDLATNPAEMTDDRRARIERRIDWFLSREDYMRTALEFGADHFDTPQMLQHYQNALDQVMSLAGIDKPSLTEV